MAGCLYRFHRPSVGVSFQFDCYLYNRSCIRNRICLAFEEVRGFVRHLLSQVTAQCLDEQSNNTWGQGDGCNLGTLIPLLIRHFSPPRSDSGSWSSTSGKPCMCWTSCLGCQYTNNSREFDMIGSVRSNQWISCLCGREHRIPTMA